MKVRTIQMLLLSGLMGALSAPAMADAGACAKSSSMSRHQGKQGQIAARAVNPSNQSPAQKEKGRG